MPVVYISPNLGKTISLLKKIFGEKDTNNIWHFLHERVKDSAAVGAYSYRWGLNYSCRI
jgi:hypothetical protein